MLCPMKKMVVLILMTITYAFANAQVFDTVSINLPVFSDTISYLKKAKGWILQNDGEWVNASNKIPHDKTVYSPKNKDFGLGKENFSSLELSPLFFNNRSMVLFLVYFEDGKYEFPIIKSGWKTYKSAYYYVFEKEKLRYLLPDTLVQGKPYSVNLDVYASGYINIKTSQQSVRNIVSHKLIEIRTKRKVNNNNLIFSLYPIKTDKKGKVLFKLIRTYSKPSIYEYFLQPALQKQIFSKFYYETDMTDFYKFIKKCLTQDETFLQQKLEFVGAAPVNDESFRSTFARVKDSLKKFDTKYEELRVDTSNFYSAPKITKYADTVAATSFVRSSSKRTKTETTKTTVDSVRHKTEKKQISDTIFSKIVKNKIDSIFEGGTKKYDTLSVNQTIKPQLSLERDEKTTSRVIFRVQIGTANYGEAQSFFRNKYQIEEEIFVIPYQQIFKYTIGNFAAYKDAKLYLEEIKSKIPGAFLIALIDDKLSPVPDAVNLINK